MNVVRTSARYGLQDISHVRRGIVIIGANNPQTGRIMQMIEVGQIRDRDFVGFIDGNPEIGATHCGLPVSSWDLLDAYIEAGCTFASVVSTPIARLESTRKVIQAGGQMISFMPPDAMLPDEMGEACYIQGSVHIDAGVIMGDNSVIHGGAVIGHETKIGRSVFIGAVCVAGRVTIDDGAFIGMGATILPDIHIGKFATVGAGAVVTKDVPDYAVVVGVPAKLLKENERKYETGAIR